MKLSIAESHANDEIEKWLHDTTWSFKWNNRYIKNNSTSIID